jgi:hypothetical protein
MFFSRRYARTGRGELRELESGKRWCVHDSTRDLRWRHDASVAPLDEIPECARGDFQSTASYTLVVRKRLVRGSALESFPLGMLLVRVECRPFLRHGSLRRSGIEGML